MLIKSSAIDRFLRDNPQLKERRFGLPLVGNILDMEKFNPTVEKIADAINFYGYEARNSEITTKKDTDLGTGNPLKFKELLYNDLKAQKLLMMYYLWHLLIRDMSIIQRVF